MDKAQVKIHYILYYSTTKNFGKAINDEVALIPDNDFICIMDGDMLFLTPDWGKQIEEVVKLHGHKFDLIGCVTNRLGRPIQLAPGVDYNNYDIKYHYQKSVEFRDKNFGQVQDITDRKLVAGLLMLFPKRLWNEIKFQENTPFFDDLFSKEVVKRGGKLGLMTGLYVYHWYRGWSDNPKSERSHLK